MREQLDDTPQLPSGPEMGMVPKEAVPTVWPQVEAIMQEKAQKWLEVVSPAEVFGWLINGDADLWLGAHNGVIDGFVICMWEVHARRKRYKVLYIAGYELEKYLAHGLEKLEQYCAILGGEEVIFRGRKGWVRWLRRFGYHPDDTVRLRKSTLVLWRN